MPEKRRNCQRREGIAREEKKNPRHYIQELNKYKKNRENNFLSTRLIKVVSQNKLNILKVYIPRLSLIQGKNKFDPTVARSQPIRQHS